MSIQALPQSTVRALGATQALTDPSSLVKELLDNALDANANSIAISISSNTLDVIQVRDNGHGIAPQDRPLAARRYCTSKICHDDDLKDIGGSSLGFRGEALASAAELSGTMLITTRVEGEEIAFALRISQKGEVVGQDRASLPVGTTVKITDFIKANPVRRQVALKSADACLKKIKRLLQAYAFARPNVRISLQVLKAKNDKGNWVYAPKLNGNAEDAAFKIVGAACASSCLWSVMEQQGLTLQAFLPRPDADVGKISNIGPFLSVDARPVSSSRGLLKQITKAFREALKAANSKFETVKDPFIFLEISGGSYDANLEPAKDDVLFENADNVLQVAKGLFAAVYRPEPPPTTVAEEPAVVPFSHAVPEEADDDFTTSLEQGLPTVPSQSMTRKESEAATNVWLENMDDQRRIRDPSIDHALLTGVRYNMYGCDAEELELYNDRPATSHTEADLAELRQARDDVTLSNPWVLAKMNAPSGRSTPGEDRRTRSPARDPRLIANTNLESSPVRYQPSAGISGLPTPRPSSPSPPIGNMHPSDHVPNVPDPHDMMMTGIPTAHIPQFRTLAEPRDLHSIDSGSIDREHHFSPDYPYTLGNSTADTTTGTRLSDIPNAGRRPRRTPMSLPNKPFVPPSKTNTPSEQVWFDHQGSSGKPKARRARQGDTNGLVARGEFGDFPEEARFSTPPRHNRDIRDFIGRDTSNSVSSMIENRNFHHSRQREESQAVTEGDPRTTEVDREESQDSTGTNTMPIETRSTNRGFVPASELAMFEDLLHPVEKQPERPSKRRRTTDRGPLQELSTNITTRTSEPTNDAEYTNKRAPSRRRSSKGIHRTKSSRLPLERILPGQGTRELTLNVFLELEQLSRLAGKIDEEKSLLSYNEPAVDANEEFATAELPDLRALTANLHRLLVTAGSDTDVVGPEGLLQEVQTAYAQHAAGTDTDAPMSSA